MAITSFRETWVSFILVGVFLLAMINFIVILQKDNGVDQTIATNPIINRSIINLGGNLTDASNISETEKSTFDDDQPDRGFGALIIFAILGVVQTFTGMIMAIYNTFIVLPATVLGVPASLISTFTSIFIVSMILLAWGLYRSGK